MEVLKYQVEMLIFRYGKNTNKCKNVKKTLNPKRCISQNFEYNSTNATIQAACILMLYANNVLSYHIALV